MRNPDVEEERCPFCNTSFEQIRASLKVGCLMCYQIFSDAGGKMDHFLRTVHSKNLHKEEKRVQVDLSEEEIMLKTQLFRLEEELRILVEREEYEKAAEVSEKISELLKNAPFPVQEEI